MKKNNKLIAVSVMLLTMGVITHCTTSPLYKYVDAAKCSKKGGYWYKNQCWKDFEDEGISVSDIDSVVTVQLKEIEQSNITLGGETYPLIAFFPINDKEAPFLVAVYDSSGNYKTFIFPIKMEDIEKGTFEAPAILFEGDAVSGTVDNPKKLAQGKAKITVIDFNSMIIDFDGSIVNKGDSSTKKFNFRTSEGITGAGNSQVEIKGNEAYLSGDLGTVTYAQVKDIISNYPEVTTIVMTEISGSVNDAVNMHTGRLIRENNLNTKVLSNSDIASGGVDLFCAGKERIVEKGAKIGVHSWCCIKGKTAEEISKDHPAHQYQIAYFTMALGPEKGVDFYFYTLKAAPFSSVYYMSDDEIIARGVSTQFIEK